MKLVFSLCFSILCHVTIFYTALRINVHETRASKHPQSQSSLCGCLYFVRIEAVVRVASGSLSGRSLLSCLQHQLVLHPILGPRTASLQSRSRVPGVAIYIYIYIAATELASG